jgi:transcriptional regulator with XRE-family HTH domain
MMKRASRTGKRPRSDVDRSVGNKIKHLRQEPGLTQHQVAKQLGVSPQQVHKLEKGSNRVFAGRLLAIARLFNVAVGDLFDGFDSGVPLAPPLDPQTSRMPLEVAQSFLELEPKHQDALVRLARALAAGD